MARREQNAVGDDDNDLTSLDPRPVQPAQFNKVELSNLTGLSVDRIDRHVRAGLPCTRSGSRGSALQFEMPKVLTWLLAAAVAEFDDVGTLPEAKRRERIAIAEKREIEVAELRSEVVRVATVEFTIAKNIASLQNRLIGIPARLNASADIKAAVLAEIRDAINEMSLDAYGA